MTQEAVAPQIGDVGRLQTVVKAVMKPLFNVLWDIEVAGLENVPRNGPAILAPNHTSVLDSFLMPAVLPRRITFVGKAEYLDDWKTKRLFPALGMIPIDRSGGDAAQRALDMAASILNSGQLFGIYPEGTRSRSGLLHKGRTGVARLALRTGAPIVPVGLQGVREIQPPDAPMPRPFKPATVRFGQPIDAARYAQAEHDPLAWRAITDDLMFSIRDLSGQEYVHEYAGKSSPAATGEQGGSGVDVVAESPLELRRSSAEVLRAAAVA